MATKKIVTTPVNGKRGKNNDKEDQAAYKLLQKQVADNLRMIDLAFKQYYTTNPHFPLSKKSQFDHWTLTREKGYTRIDVFFKENMYDMKYNGNGNGYTQENHKEQEQKMKAKQDKALALAPEESGSSDSGSLPQIYTYDEVGAPPSGPKDPRPKT